MHASNETFLTRREIRSLMVWIVAGALGCACFAAFYGRVMLKSSVTMTVGRSEAKAISHDFMDDLGLSTEGYSYHITFDKLSGSAKLFLEKELGFEAADAMMRDTVDVWYWRSRWNRSDEEESFRVGITPGGRVISFRHTVPEAAEGAVLSPEEAQSRALTFIGEFTDLDLDEYRLVETVPNERPHRIDHEFRWEKEGFDVHGATLRVRVTVQGDEIGDYRQYLEIPEEWKQSESRDERLRVVLWLAPVVGTLGFYIAALIVFIVWMRRRRLRFEFAIPLASALVVAHVISRPDNLGLALINGLFCALIVGSAGDALARQVFPRRPPISDFTKRSFWTSKEVFIAAVVGCCLPFLHGAFIYTFRFVAGELGAVTTVGSPYQNILEDFMPWMTPFTGGFIPALQEELMYRLFVISLLLFLFKRPWLAVIISSVIWGFLHSIDPVDPVYLRGIEITVVGIAFGIVFLRYGIVATLIAHYAFNAINDAMPMIQSEDPYLRWSGIAVVGLMFVPVVPGALIVLRRKSFTGYTPEDTATEDP